MTAYRFSALLIISAGISACGPVRSSRHIPEIPFGAHGISLGSTKEEVEALDPKARIKSLGPRFDLVTINTPLKKAVDGAQTYIGSGIFLDGKLVFLTMSLSWFGASPKYVLGQKNMDLLQKEFREELEVQYGVPSTGPTQAMLGLSQAQMYSWTGKKFTANLVLPTNTSGKDNDLIGIFALTQGLDTQNELALKAIQRLLRPPFDE